MNELKNEWMNEWTNEGTKERKTERTNAERTNGWMNERVRRWMKGICSIADLVNVVYLLYPQWLYLNDFYDFILKGSQLDAFCIAFCYIEFKISYLKNLKSFSVK